MGKIASIGRPTWPPTYGAAMSDDRLNEELARQVLGWKVAPDRFLLGGRRWLPRWRFQPTKKLTDAIRLLEAAKPQEYSMAVNASRESWAKVKIRGTTAQAQGKTQPLAICRAVAAAYGIEVDL